MEAEWPSLISGTVDEPVNDGNLVAAYNFGCTVRRYNMNKSISLRVALSQKRLLRVVGAHNALGARLGERAGFDGVWASGLEISTSYGLPDASILSMTELLHQA